MSEIPEASRASRSDDQAPSPADNEVACSVRARDGVTLAYRLRRTLDPRGTLVLIHGMASNLTRWSEFVAATRLGARWDLLRLDLRGHGRSLTRRGVSMDGWCGDLKDILDHVTAARAVLAGHCLGAHVAANFALRYPERVSGLILLEPLLPEALTWRARLLRALRPVLSIAAAVTLGLNRIGLRRSRFLERDLFVFDREARGAGAWDWRSTLRYLGPRLDLQSMPTANYLRDLIEVLRPLPPLERVRRPILTVISSGKLLYDPAATRVRLERVPDCETAVLQAHHWVLTEAPAAVRAAIERWCERLAERAAE